MKLPSKDKFSNQEMHYLYQCDLNEFFSTKTWGNYLYTERFNFIADFIHEHISKGSKIVDIGCAQGNYSISLAEQGYEVIGIDIRPNFLKYARLKLEDIGKNNMHFCVGDAKNLSYSGDAFDCVLLLEIIEHISEPEKVLLEARRVLKEDGFLVFSTVNKNRVKSKSMSFNDFRQKKDKGNITTITDTARGDEHLFELTEKECIDLLNSCGFNVLNSSIKVFMGMYILMPILKFLPMPYIKYLGQVFLNRKLLRDKFGLDMIIFAKKK
jgi:ubiquinone/menaquinone biosynthesis C-methylase UbiE